MTAEMIKKNLELEKMQRALAKKAKAATAKLLAANKKLPNVGTNKIVAPDRKTRLEVRNADIPIKKS